MPVQENALNLSPLPLAVFVVDADGAIASWNNECEKLAGYGGAGIRKQKLEDIIEFDVVSGPAPTIAGRAEIDSTGFLRCADGRRLPVRVTVAPQSLDPEQPGTFSVIVIPRAGPILPRYALIQDLPVGDIIEGLPCVFYVIDQSGHLLLWNQQLEDALEMSSEELPSINVSLFFEEKDRPDIVQKILDAFEHGHSSHEAELIGRQGKRTSLLFHCARTSLGELPVIFGTGLDISARKQTEQGLRGREPRFMRIEGCDVHEHKRVHYALKNKESVQVVLRNARKNGEVFWIDLRIDPVSNADGEITHFVAVISDITEARHYERRLHHMAHHDPLTGLANRSLLQDELKFSIDFAVRNKVLGANGC